MMKQILPGIFVWSWYAEHKGYNFNLGDALIGKDGGLRLLPPEKYACKKGVSL